MVLILFFYRMHAIIGDLSKSSCHTKQLFTHLLGSSNKQMTKVQRKSENLNLDKFLFKEQMEIFWEFEANFEKILSSILINFKCDF